MNIFITGGRGFIGSALSDYLFKNFSYSLFIPGRNELDLLNEYDVDEYIISNKIDIVIHAANIGGSRNIVSTTKTLENNLRMFFNVAKNSNRVKKIILLGSGAEYSKHKPIVLAQENDSDKGFPYDEYGFYKSVVSRFVEKSENMLNLRIFGCYGEKEDYRFRFISNSIVKNLLKLPIVINQNVLFDYIYIGDLVKIIAYFIDKNNKYKIYNATSGQKIDLVTLAKIINEVSEYKSDIELIHSGFNKEYTSNNSRLLKELGDFQFTEHQEAIKMMRNYYLNNLNDLDKKTIVEDSYLERCNTMWKK